MRIFVTGYQRSGTTLLRRVLHNHPDVQGVLHEKRILNKQTEGTIKEVKGFNWEGTESGTWGEKVPWSEGSSKNIIAYCDEWNKHFDDYNPKIIYIVRNPVSVGLSNKIKFKMPMESTIKMWKASVYDVATYIDSLDNSLIITFEDLVSNSEKVLKKLYGFCELDNSTEVTTGVCESNGFRYFSKIEPSRAFSYKECTTLSKYTQLIEEYNKSVARYIVL